MISAGHQIIAQEGADKKKVNWICILAPILDIKRSPLEVEN